MKYNDIERVCHMLDALAAAISFVSDRKSHDLDQDKQLNFACIRAFEVVGEAATKLSADFRLRHNEIPWRDIIGLRNRLIHDYLGVDNSAIWKLIIYDAPLLIKQLQHIIDHSSQTESTL